MRGDLVSRPIGEVLREAEQLVRAGVKELLVISQDTSAYGVDLKYAAQGWRGAPRRARFYDLAAALGELGVWVRLHYVYPYPHVDAVIELMADGARAALSRHPVPARQRPHPEADEAPGRRREHAGAHRRLAPAGARHHAAQHFHRRLPGRDRGRISRNCSIGCAPRSSTGSAASSTRRSRARRPTRCAEPGAAEVKRERHERFMELAAEISARASQRRSGARMRVLVDRIDGGVGDRALRRRCAGNRRHGAHPRRAGT